MYIIDVLGALLMMKARKAMHSPGGLVRKCAVTVLGKQPGSSIWALGPDIFIDEDTGTSVFVIALSSVKCTGYQLLVI